MADGPPPPDGTTTTTRLEAFSDGVFAIAITLLILEIKVPHVGEGGAGGLAHALAERWPSYVAYAVSFLTIGVIWANHHAVMDHVRRADRGLLMMTVFFLMAVSFLPFPTAVLAEHLAGGPGRDRTTAALFFGGAYVWMAIGFNLLWGYIRRAGLLYDPAHPGARAITNSFRYGPLTYFVVMLLALVSVPMNVAATGLLAVYWAFPRTPRSGAGTSSTPGDGGPPDALS